MVEKKEHLIVLLSGYGDIEAQIIVCAADNLYTEVEAKIDSNVNWQTIAVTEYNFNQVIKLAKLLEQRLTSGKKND